MGENESNHSIDELSDHPAHEEFTLRTSAQVISVLREISKRPDMVTAFLDGSGRQMLTAVLGVIPERGVLVLDYGPDEALNRRALGAERVVCVTRHDGIVVRFVLSGLTKAKFQGREVFAAPIPESVLRLQRREFFRVQTPMMNPVTCRIPCAEGKDLTLQVLDISVGGIGVMDHTCTVDTTPGTLLAQCTLVIPEFDSVGVDLQVRNAFKARHRDGAEGNRIGCVFTSLRGEKLMTIQRYVNKLQLDQRAAIPQK